MKLLTAFTNKIKRIITNQKGLSLVETLFAMAYIALTVGALMNLTVGALRMSIINKTRSEMIQYANQMAEEMVKDVITTGSVISEPTAQPEDKYSHYCTNVDVYISEDQDSSCSIIDDNAPSIYQIKILYHVYDRDIEITRDVLF